MIFSTVFDAHFSSCRDECELVRALRYVWCLATACFLLIVDHRVATCQQDEAVNQVLVLCVLAVEENTFHPWVYDGLRTVFLVLAIAISIWLPWWCLEYRRPCGEVFEDHHVLGQRARLVREHVADLP